MCIKNIMIKIGSDFSGVGAFNQALQRLKIPYDEVFACDMDKYARQTFILNFGNDSDKEIIKHKDYKKVADIFHREFVDKKLLRPTAAELSFAYANCEFISRQFSFYFPWNVYNRKIPKESLDIYMSSPPCQSFSLAGKRKGEDDKRGILFYNTHEFIQKNRPRFFMIENVKGLLSDDKGKTFQRWIDFLGGKSVNGNTVIFPHQEATPYHVYYHVLNAKHYGIPQNRERIFIIGIRDDVDHDFQFPKPFPLEKRLKDVLESEVDEKYFLSNDMIKYLVTRKDNFNNGKINFKDENSVASTLTKSSSSLDISDNILKIGFINQDTQASQVFSENGTSPNICAGTHGYANGYVETKIGAEIKIIGNLKGQKGHNVQNYYDVGGVSPTVMENHGNVTKVVIPTNNSKGFDKAEEEEDSINFSNPNSETRRGRVGKKVAQTLDTACNQGIYTQQRIRRLTPLECFRLMDFNESFKWEVSDSQAYKQAGNSICVGVLVEIIKKLKIK